jgi:hypothetical protein
MTAKEAINTTYNWTSYTARELVQFGRLLPREASESLSKRFYNYGGKVTPENVKKHLEGIERFRREIEEELKET